MTRTEQETCTVYSIPDELGNFASVRVPIDPTTVMIATRSFPNGIPVGKNRVLTSVPSAVVAPEYASKFPYALYYGRDSHAALIGFCDTSVHGSPAPKAIMKRSQDATNEIWSVIMQRKYPTPGAMKRAIEHEIRSGMEALLSVPSTTDGSETGYNLLGGRCDQVAPNPNEDDAAIRRLTLAVHKMLQVYGEDQTQRQREALKAAKGAVAHPQVRRIKAQLEEEGLL